MKKFAWVLGLILTWITGCLAQDTPRIAVFDPQTSINTRFRMDTAEMSAAVRVLESAGLGVARLTAAQIAAASEFGADRFDVLVMRGDALPRADFPAIHKFADDGGVLVALAAKNPFYTAVAQKPGGQWTYSPELPQFSWQTNEISQDFGARSQYRPALFDGGVRHTSTPLWKKYLPSSTDHTGMLGSAWVTPAEGGAFYPLVRSQRGDGRDVTPQIYIARRGKCTAVISSSDRWTKGDPEWPLGDETTIALVRVAIDLRRGALQLTDTDKIDLSTDLPPPEPLTTRHPTGEVNPDDAPVVTRWGKFDGSGLDLDEKTVLPRILRPEQSVTLPLASNDRPIWLRVRGAIAESGAVLKVTAGTKIWWNESLAYLDVGRVGNFGDTDLGGVPCEFNRRVFLPPTEEKSLTLANNGDKPLYFDAAQIENAPAKPVRWMTGMGAATNQNRLKGPVNLPPERTAEWTGIRGTLWAQDVKAPGESDRWSVIDRRLDGYLSTGAPLELLIEGTPAWAAISADRYQAAERKSTVPPDPAKYREILQHTLEKYANKVDLYEIWNEVDSPGYWLGNADEYVRFWRTVVPLIRQHDPTARVMLSGMTGFSARFLETIVAAGLTGEAEMIGFHPYAGNQAAWDKPFTTFQGQLYALGQNIEIYNNEMGFPNSSTDWFTSAPFPYTPATQGRMTDVALSRLLANGVAKFSIFLSGGADGNMSYIDSRGQPYPGYRVLQDYFPLSKNGGERLDISMARTDGGAQRGVYLAGARHDDGSVTLVINPSEAVVPDFAAPADAPPPALDIPLVLRIPLAKAEAWKAVFGDASVPVEMHEAGGCAWGEVRVNLKTRTVLTLSHS